MALAHRRLRRALTESELGTAKALGACSGEGAKTDAAETSLSESVARALETFWFPMDETQDLARGCPALLTLWLSCGLDDVRAIAESTGIREHPALESAVNAYLETVRQAMDHLKREYRYVCFPQHGLALTYSQSTESEEYQAQQTIMLEDRAIMIVETIDKLWRETLSDLEHSQGWPGLCSYLDDNRDFWKFPKWWSSERVARFTTLVGKQAEHERGAASTADLSLPETSKLYENLLGLRKVCRSPVQHLCTALRDRTCDRDLIESVLHFPALQSTLIAEWKERLISMLPLRTENSA